MKRIGFTKPISPASPYRIPAMNTEGLETRTSEDQEEVEEACNEFLIALITKPPVRTPLLPPFTPSLIAPHRMTQAVPRPPGPLLRRTSVAYARTPALTHLTSEHVVTSRYHLADPIWSLVRSLFRLPPLPPHFHTPHSRPSPPPHRPSHSLHSHKRVMIKGGIITDQGQVRPVNMHPSGSAPLPPPPHTHAPHAHTNYLLHRYGAFLLAFLSGAQPVCSGV